ncbi:MAG: outer membrane protein assembly factor BamA [Buchnera aphidicola (Eriosoma harunire)]
MIKVIKKIMIVFLILCFISIFNVVSANNKWFIKDIKFKGLHHVSIYQVLKIITIKKNKLLSEKDIKKAINVLFHTHQFDKIKVFLCGNILLFQVHETPIISHIIINNTQIFSLKMLKKYLNDLDITEGNHLNNFSIHIFKNQIESIYKKIGQQKFKIVIFYHFLKNYSVDIHIFLKDGMLYHLKKINLIGVKHFSVYQIKKLLKTNFVDSWNNLFIKEKYNPILMQSNLKILENFYLKHGYINFTINDFKTDVDHNKKTVSVEIKLNEGKKYYLSKIIFHSKLLSICKKYINIVSYKNGEVFDVLKMNMLKHMISNQLHNNGYYRAKVSFRTDVNHYTHNILLHIDISLGQRFIVNKIYFRGIRNTKDSFLYKIIGISNSDIFNKNKCYYAQKILQDTNFFKKIKVHIVSTNIKSNMIDIIFHIKEKKNATLNFSAGYGVETGLNLDLGLTNNNWLGSGKLLKAHVINNSHQVYGEMLLNNPYWIPNKQMWVHQVFYHQSKKNEYDPALGYVNKSYGFESNIKFLLNRHNQFQLGYGFVHHGVRNLQSNVLHFGTSRSYQDAFQYVNNVHQDSNDFFINTNFKNSYNNLLNHNMFKSVLDVVGKVTTPGSDNHFYKFILKTHQSLYLDHKKYFRLLFRSMLGIANSWSYHGKIPFYENFYAGGVDSVRGFIVNSIGPKLVNRKKSGLSCVTNNISNICSLHRSIGGNNLIVSNIDLFIPKLFMRYGQKNKFFPSIFLDLGTVWDNKINNYINHDKLLYTGGMTEDIHSSFGMSLRWHSILGEMVLSYAQPIGNYNTDEIEKIQFNIGKFY